MQPIVRIIAAELKEAGIEDAKQRTKIARRVVKRLSDNKPSVAEWVAELGVFRFIGFVNTKRPTYVRDVAQTKNATAAYVAHQETE